MAGKTTEKATPVATASDLKAIVAGLGRLEKLITTAAADGKALRGEVAALAKKITALAPPADVLRLNTKTKKAGS